MFRGKGAAAMECEKSEISHIHVRVARQEYIEFRKALIEEGLTVTEYVLQSIRDYLKARASELEAQEGRRP